MEAVQEECGLPVWESPPGAPRFACQLPGDHTGAHLFRDRNMRLQWTEPVTAPLNVPAPSRLGQR
jgi:hypothetical protein